MQKILKKSICLIKADEPIIVPTDTVYGLVCRFDSKKAIEKIYRLKNRSRRKPLILLGYNWHTLKKFVNPNKNLKSKIQNLKSCWPGPLTIILPASDRVPKFLNKDFNTIGIRMPNNRFLLKLLKLCPGKVLASTSANISGKSDKKPQKEMLKKIKLFVKAKKGEMSLKPSRVVEITKSEVKVIR